MNDWLRGKTARTRMSLSHSMSMCVCVSVSQSVSVYVPIGNVSFGINGSRFTARVASALYYIWWDSFIFSTCAALGSLPGRDGTTIQV